MYISSPTNIRSKIEECNYNKNYEDYIINIIQKIIEYPKIKKYKIDTENINGDNIIKIMCFMEISFSNKAFNVPILIFILKKIPYESPKFFLELVEYSAANYDNKTINSDTDQIITNSLINWTKDSNIINVMDEIFNSFTNIFPIYKSISIYNSSSKEISQLLLH